MKQTNPTDNELYYWYDPESGDLEELIEEEFQQRINEVLGALYNWENVVAN